MQKTIIAAAITAALGFAGTAAAETTVYGKLHASFGQTTTDAGTKYSANQMKSHASRLGFKGSKEMANGMTITGQLEYEIDNVGDANDNNDANYIKSRNTYIGLKGGFGEVRAGIHDLPHKMATADLDPLSDTYADYNNIIQRDNRKENTLMYLNTFGNVGLAVSYSGGADSGTSTATENKDAITSAMINYKAGPLYLAAAMESQSDVTAGNTESSAKFGAGYTFGPATLGVVYYTEAKKDATDTSGTYASLAWKVSDAGTVKLAYGKYDEANTGDDPTMTAVAYDHKLDKDANVYVLYATGDKGGLASKGGLAGKGTAAVVGMVYKF